MDIAQIFGDYIHLLGMLIMLAKLWFTRNCAGISGKTQLLYAMVFTAGFSDLTIRYNSLYNTILKIIYMSITYCIVLSIFLFFKKTYDRKRDAFRIELLIVPAAVFSLFLNEAFETAPVFRSFAVFLESVAILPQVYLVSKSKEIEAIVVSYVSCLGLYRGCYIMHWLYAYFRRGHLDRLAVASGIVQLVFYCDFLGRNLPILKSKGAGGEGGAGGCGRHQPPTSLSVGEGPDDVVVVLAAGAAATATAAAAAAANTATADEDETTGDERSAMMESGGDKRSARRVVGNGVVQLPAPTLSAEEKVTLLMDKEQRIE